MFNSLRSRLWLTYALIVLMVLCVGILGLVVALRQSPLLYRQTINQLDVTTELLVRRLEPIIDLAPQRFLIAFAGETQDTTVKSGLFDLQGNFLDSNIQDNDAILRTMGQALEFSTLTQNDAALFEGDLGKEWFYKVRLIGDKYYLLTIITKPSYKFSTIVKDEFMGPLIQAGLIVLVLAFFVSLVISNWIALPLKRVAESAEALSEGDLIEIPLEGPKEVRRLANTFNIMSHKITASAQSQREFIVNVSHEFKTPLTSIQGFAQAILDGTVKSEKEINKAANVIMIETNRLHRLVMDLLMLARLEAGTADMQHEEVHIRPLLGNMVDKFSLQAEQQKVHLIMREIAGVSILGDGDRLAQVFSNLIDNALKYTSEEGKVEISSSVDEKHIIIAVQDSGIGIPEADQEKIFERFYQIESTRKYGKKKGFGLGLSIAKEIIQSHDGRIWVESHLNEGSTFFVELPILKSKR